MWIFIGGDRQEPVAYEDITPNDVVVVKLMWDGNVTQLVGCIEQKHGTSFWMDYVAWLGADTVLDGGAGMTIGLRDCVEFTRVGVCKGVQ